MVQQQQQQVVAVFAAVQSSTAGMDARLKQLKQTTFSQRGMAESKYHMNMESVYVHVSSCLPERAPQAALHFLQHNTGMACHDLTVVACYSRRGENMLILVRTGSLLSVWFSFLFCAAVGCL